MWKIVETRLKYREPPSDGMLQVDGIGGHSGGISSSGIVWHGISRGS